MSNQLHLAENIVKGNVMSTLQLKLLADRGSLLRYHLVVQIIIGQII